MNSTTTATISDFSLTSSWVVKDGAISGSASTTKATKTAIVVIPSGNKATAAVLSCSISSPYGGVDFMRINDTAAVPGSHTQSVNVTGSGSYGFEFVFKAIGNNSGGDGSHYGTVTFTNVVLTVTYEADEDPQPQPSPETVLESEGLILLYAKDEENFDSNGLCVLCPSSCVITEQAGGYYNLEMQHPMDEWGKWAMIEENSIIRAPVPPLHIPAVTLPQTVIWQVKSSVNSTPVYSKLPNYTAAKTPIDTVRNNTSVYAWSADIAYTQGAYVVFTDNNIYEAGQNMVAGIAPTAVDNRNKWIYRASVSTGSSSSASGGTYDPGTVITNLSGGTTFSKVADYNSDYMQIRTLLGVTGYIRRADCEATEQTAEGTVIPARDIKTQLFRVQSIENDEEDMSVKVTAQHISYDFAGNAIFDCQLNEATPQTAIAILQGSLMLEDHRQIICNITDKKVTADWSFQNPIMALLDPDDGLLGKVKGKLIRDNKDIYIIDNSTPNKGPRISYGVNMIGVQWERNIEDLITRVIPRAGDGNQGYVYLDELFVDSAYIDDYPVIRIEVLDTDWSVGQEIELPDGTKQTLTLEDVKAKMREDAQKRFDDDYVDAVLVNVKTQFLLLGDTMEYSQYKGLQRLNLYDAVPIDTGPSGVSISAEVNYYEWDAIRRRYNEMGVGTVKCVNRKRIPGYRVNNGAISYAKLAPAVAKAVRGE